jgi:hypothetical protein
MMLYQFPVYMGCAPCAFNKLIFTDKKKDDAVSVMGNALPHPEKLEIYQSWT